MENNYKHQQSTNESIVDEMEKRLVDLRSNVEHLQQIKQKLAEEKSQLIKNNEQLQLQVSELTRKKKHKSGEQNF
jgi:regulator of replication initiation timing